MRTIQFSVLNSYEKAIANDELSLPSAQVGESKRTKALVDAMLSAKGNEGIEMEDGTVVFPTVEEALVAKAIQAELEHPKGLETVERLMKIRGELSDSVAEVSVSLVDKDLAARALT